MVGGKTAEESWRHSARMEQHSATRSACSPRTGSLYPGFRIRIHFMRIRIPIQGFKYLRLWIRVHILGLKFVRIRIPIQHLIIYKNLCFLT